MVIEGADMGHLSQSIGSLAVAESKIASARLATSTLGLTSRRHLLGPFHWGTSYPMYLADREHIPGKACGSSGHHSNRAELRLPALHLFVLQTRIDMSGSDLGDRCSTLWRWAKAVSSRTRWLQD